MSSRVHRISKLHQEVKPVVERERALRRHTRAARRHAFQMKQMDGQLKKLLDSLPDRKKPELLLIAKGMGIAGYSKMNKAQLVQAIRNGAQ